MPRFPLVRWIALFWGFSVFFPISWNYLALGGLMVAMVWEGGLRVRLGRLRAQPNWWAAWGYLGWVALVLVAGAHYPETSVMACGCTSGDATAAPSTKPSHTSMKRATRRRCKGADMRVIMRGSLHGRQPGQIKIRPDGRV